MRSKAKLPTIEPEKRKQTDASKEDFIGTSLTLRRLQKKKIIPSQINPIMLKTKELLYPRPNPGSKYLLISERNVVYYGELNTKGSPDSSHAIFIFSDGSYFEGQVKNGKPSGEGKITNLENSYSYHGQWKLGLPEGYGKEIIGNNIYDGNFLNGKKHGSGTLTFADGSQFRGTFHQNTIEGQGEYINGCHYWQGHWINGYMEGPGRQIISKKKINGLQEIQEVVDKGDHSEYIGNFYKGEKSGTGIFRWGKNYEYDGQFNKGQLNGEGTFKFKGKIYAGVWSNGTEVKIAELGKGVNSVLMTGNISEDGNIVMQGSKSRSIRSSEHTDHNNSLRIKKVSCPESEVKDKTINEFQVKSAVEAPQREGN